MAVSGGKFHRRRSSSRSTLLAAWTPPTSCAEASGTGIGRASGPLAGVPPRAPWRTSAFCAVRCATAAVSSVAFRSLTTLAKPGLPDACATSCVMPAIGGGCMVGTVPPAASSNALPAAPSAAACGRSSGAAAWNGAATARAAVPTAGASAVSSPPVTAPCLAPCNRCWRLPSVIVAPVIAPVPVPAARLRIAIRTRCAAGAPLAAAPNRGPVMTAAGIPAATLIPVATAGCCC